MTSRSLDSTMSSFNEDATQFPNAKSPYGTVTHTIRRIVPEKIACKVGCRGNKCKYDNSDWPEEKMAIKGLFSHWITEDILAMARPRTNLINDFNLIHQMKKAQIRSIFNLQSRNEHKDCGAGLHEESGFSYNPIDFTSTGIFYYNYELEDYSSASMRNMIDMVKVLCFALEEGKAAIHCHAGLGRTGLFIACYLIYSRRISANEAIHFIREKRPGSVQMVEQIEAIKQFESYLRPLHTVYTENALDNYNQENSETSFTNQLNFNLRTFLHRQRLLLHGRESKKLKYIPKILYVCGERLRKLIINWNADGVDVNKFKEIQRFSNELTDDILKGSFKSKQSEPNPSVSITQGLILSNNLNRKYMKRLRSYQEEINKNNHGTDIIANETDPIILGALIWSWLDQLKEPVLKDQEINILLRKVPQQFINKKFNDEALKYPMNWDELETDTLHTVNYLTNVFHDLLPLDSYLEDSLVTQLMWNLTHTKLESFSHQDHTLTANFRLKKTEYIILKHALSELIRKPISVSKKTLGKIQFKKEIPIDYAEETREQNKSSISVRENRQSRSRVKRSSSK